MEATIDTDTTEPVNAIVMVEIDGEWRTPHQTLADVIREMRRRTAMRRERAEVER